MRPSSRPPAHGTSRNDYASAIAGRLEEQNNDSYFMCMGNPDKETRNTCDRAQQVCICIFICMYVYVTLGKYIEREREISEGGVYYFARN
jgi:hypothetical protein